MTDPFPTDGIAFYKDKKVAVTGASGLIGSYAVKLLVESGARVRAIVNTRSPSSFTLRASDLVIADLLRPDWARYAVNGCEIVIGCAGITGGVNLPSLDPVSYVGPATAIVINTLHACHLTKVARFGYLSSTTVYAPAAWPVEEDDVDRPDALYPLYRGIGYSKRFCEQLCRYYQETTGLAVGIIRPAGAYGRFDNFDEKTSHVLPGMVSRALRQKDAPTFEVWGDGQDIRDFVHAQDVARGLLLATAQGTGVPYNIASGQGVSTATLARLVLDAVGSKAEIVVRPDKPSALRKRLVSIERARAALGFEPQVRLAVGIEDVVAWQGAVT